MKAPTHQEKVITDFFLKNTPTFQQATPLMECMSSWSTKSV